MTGDELAAAVYAVQGFLVMESNTPEELGAVVKCSNLIGVKTPLRVTGPSNQKEFLAQAKLGYRLAQSPLVGIEWEPGNFKYYRVEAAD